MRPEMLKEAPKVWPCLVIAVGMLAPLATIAAIGGYAIWSAVS